MNEIKSQAVSEIKASNANVEHRTRAVYRVTELALKAITKIVQHRGAGLDYNQVRNANQDIVAIHNTLVRGIAASTSKTNADRLSTMMGQIYTIIETFTAE